MSQDEDIPPPPEEGSANDNETVGLIKLQIDWLLDDDDLKPLERLEALERVRDYVSRAIDLVEQDLRKD